MTIDLIGWYIGIASIIVAGIIWKITAKDLGILREWEYDGVWREFIMVKARNFEDNIVNCLTEKAINSGSCSGYYDGLNYPDNLNPQNPFITQMEKKSEDLYKIDKLRELRIKLQLFSVKQTLS